jgi:dienelactone hydrolase
MGTAATQIQAYEKNQFKAQASNGHSISHDIYRRGSGAPVILLQELPGIGQETLSLADELVNAGFEVVMPHLFGPLGKTSIGGNLVRVMCLRKEFHLMSRDRSSPLADWIRLLCKEVKDQRGVQGVGVIGMCLTGNFAIKLIGDDSVLAAVASQPAMPFFEQGSLHMSPDEIIQSCNALDTKGPMRVLRFEGDPLCTVEKSKCIHRTFNEEGFTRVQEITLPGKGHSVLTLDFVDEVGHPTREALDNVIRYFDSHLSASKL